MSKKVETQGLEELGAAEADVKAETGAAALGTPAARAAAQAPQKESLLIPLDPNGASGSVFLCVNGRNLLVKRGEPVRVPPEFAEAYRNAQRQQLAAVKAQRAAMSKE